jgi:hypothetical protein
MLFSMRTGAPTQVLAVLVGTVLIASAEDIENIRQRIKVPPNQVMVLNPFEGAQVDHADLPITVASGYGVLTFLSITVNGKLAVKVANVEAGGLEDIVLPKKHLKHGKNRLRIDSWHQMPGQTQRLESFTAPEITIQVKPIKSN